MKKSEAMDIDVREFSMAERFELIKLVGVNRKALNYLKQILKDLTIIIGGNYVGNIITLMRKGQLEGWCWQTTESAIVFFNDDDYIERGNLKLGICKDNWFRISYCQKYSHSWICFSYNNKIWVFDPCLQIIVEKDIYYYVFEIKKVEGIVTAKSVREELVYRINNHKPTENISERERNETKVYGNDDVTSLMYRNNTGYTATFNNGKINTLIAHYYYNG